ncbi:TIGR03943 family protein [Paenibacillus nanensis]|uniref:TIGR03943 family protein n=1 Tax=Paenibacillus nanensis TaxID=393251 RepID=A0A3A1V0T2_9BACL|nr:TIGR03943 family protein [Paenibacillus nanensis]RIX53062.1 TIGR03943 family protein [Paenibacillus nanensis]
MIHHFVRAVILAGFAFMIVYLFRTEQMTLYIAPRMELLVKLTALGLYAASVYQVYAALQARLRRHNHPHTENCGCGQSHHKSPFKNAVMYGLFIFPLLLVFLVPAGTLGSALAEKKGISFTGSETVSRSVADNKPSTAWHDQSPATQADEQPSLSPTLEQLFPYDEYTADHAKLGMELYKQSLITVPDKQFIETLTTLDLYRGALLGKEVEISGFVYREEEMGSGKMAVSRFAMNCCSADALPYGLMTLWPKAGHYAEDEWVTVRGKLTLTQYGENEIIAIEAIKVERIPAPESPYVYPDLEFGL